MAKTPTEIASLARSHCPQAIEVLRGIMNSPRASEQARIAACVALLNRGDGLPKMTAETTVEHRFVVEMPAKLTSEEWEKEYGGQTAH